MEKRGQSGGLICLNSFIKLNDLQEIRTSNMRTASIAMREAAAKEGIQSLYADPEDVLEKYKESPVVQAMEERKDQKILWVRARAIDADITNANGDYFSKEELLAEVEDKGKKIPAYKTFEGVPIYTNHKNDDIEQAKGMVVYAEWDEDENCVYVVFFVDEQAYPHIARGIRQGYMHDVSMGCQVESGTCSICGHKALTEKEYCEHMEKYKGKIWPKTGERAYEKNHGLKFIELSVVGDGAFETCEIQEIYDVDDILTKALDLHAKVASINSNILIASSMLPKDIEERQAYEKCLRQVASTTKETLRLAQSAGTLVGGQLLAGQGGGQNTTVSNILQFLGIEPSSGLNILDMLNLALNFLEVTVMNLFSRKDNVDLSHVAKITKSMGDLQATMQDMIDDGVDTSGGARNNIPLNQGTLDQQQQPQQPEGSNQPAPEYSTAGQVGRAMGPMPTQNNAFMISNPGIGGGAVANKKRLNVVWASKDKDDIREVFASTNTKKTEETNNKLTNLGEKLNNFAKALGIPAQPQSSNVRSAENHQPIKTNTSTTRVSGGNSMNNNDVFNQFAGQRRKQNAKQVSLDFNVDDQMGNRLTLSSDGTVKAYHKGQRVAWEPTITEEQLDQIETNGIAVATQLLDQLSNAITAAANSGKTIVAIKEPETETEEVMEEQVGTERKGTDDDVKEHIIEDKRTGTDNKTREETLEEVRKGTPELGEVWEQMLGESGLYSRKGTDDDVKEKLLEDARLSEPKEVIELQLDEVRAGMDKTDPKKAVEAATNALANAVVATLITPEEAIDAAKKLASREDLAQLIVLSYLGKKNRERIASRIAFHNVGFIPVSTTAAVIDALGREVCETVTAADLAETLKVASTEETMIKNVSRVADSKGNGTLYAIKSNKNIISKEDRIRAAIAAQSGNNDNTVTADHIKAAIYALAESVIDSQVTPDEVVATIKNANENTLLTEVELARTAASVKTRLANRKRRQYWGNRFASNSKIDVFDNIVGWLADYSDAYKFDSATSIVTAVKRTTDKEIAATKLVARMVEAGLSKKAGVAVTDEKTITKRIQARVEDFPGVDVKSEDFENVFRDKAIEILTASGSTVDPNTFTLSELTVTESGDITASVTSRMSKTFKADAAATPVETPIEGGAAASDGATVTVEGEVPVEPGNEVSIETVPEEETIMTAAAKAARKAKRAELLKKYAQMPPAPAAPAGGGMPPAGGSPMTDALSGAGQADAGISALTGDDMGMDQGMDNANPEGEPTPGKQAPWGTICPQCGSTDVDVANGEGECKDCGAQLHFKFIVESEPGTGKPQANEGGEELPGEEPGLDELGLGGATAPAPAAPAAPGGAGAAPGVMAQASWDADADIFVRLASNNINRETEKVLPVGFICPACGNRTANKHMNTTFCHNCGMISKSEIRKCLNDPTKLSVSIKWM